MDELTCITRDIGDLTVVDVRGDVDLGTSPRLRQATEAAITDRSPRLIIDLTGCTFLNSSGLSALVSAARHARAEGGWVNLVCSRDNKLVTTVLEMTNLKQFMPIYQTLGDATEAAKYPQPDLE